MAITVSEMLNGVASRLVYEGSLCDSHPCWNDGKCFLNSSLDFYCQCPIAFVGKRCEHNIFDLCKSSKCQGASICDNDNFQVNCTLISQKDFLSSCVSTHCLNGGTCTNTSGIYRCVCPKLFHGPFCQIDSNDLHYEWSAMEISIFLFVILLVSLAVLIVCCACRSSNHMGLYISVPDKHYNRWEDEDDMFDDSTEGGEQLMAMADIKKHLRKDTPSISRGIVVSRTRETVLEDIEDGPFLEL